MKKILMTIAAAFVAVSMNAQVYVGGSIGMASVGGENMDDETVVKFLPEIGYNLNDEWAVGTVVGYAKSKIGGVTKLGSLGYTGANSESCFVFAPYARYTFLKGKNVSVFIDGGFDFTSGSDGDYTALSIGLKPGVAVSLAENISFVAHAGFIGYDSVNPDGDNNNKHAWGLDLGSNNLNFGLYFNF